MRFSEVIRAVWCGLGLLLAAGASPAQPDSPAAAASPYRSAELVGDHPVDDAELSRALRLPLPADSLKPALRRLAGVLFARGWLAATVHAEAAADGVLRLRIHAGEPARLTHVFLRGTEALAAEEAREITGLREGGVYVPVAVEEGLQALVDVYARRGHLHAEAVVERLEILPEGVVLGIAVSEGPVARLTEVQVHGNSHSRSSLVQRLSGLGPTRGVDLRRLRESTLLLRRSGLFAAVEEPLVYRAGSGEGELGVMLRVVEAPQRNAFYGSVGVAQDPRDRSAYLHGAVDLQLRNIWGTGRDLALAWKRDAIAGSNLGVGYRERFLAGWRLDLTLDLAQTVRDSTYTYQTAGAAVVLPLRSNLGLELGGAFDRSVFHVQPEGDAHRMRGRLGLLFQSLASPGDGRPYGKLEVRAEYARKSNSFVVASVPDNTTYEQTVWSGLYEAGWPLGRRHELWGRGAWQALFSDEDQIVDSELYYFGGARTLRGYREDQFRGDQVAYGGIEYRFGDPRAAQLVGFFDAGGLRRKQAGAETVQEAHFGYGVGLRGQVATGIFDIAFALGEERSWSAAKLHVSLLQRF